jgi:hypothetical protein
MSGVFTNPTSTGSIQIVPFPGPDLPYNFNRDGANVIFNNLDPTGQPSVTTIPSPATYDPAYGNGPYRGLVLGADGKLYSAPWLTSSEILVIDPTTNTASMQSFGVTGLPFDVGNYVTGALAPNGKIYFPPWKHNKVLVIDPANNTSYYMTPTFSGEPGYSTAILGTNGRIYCLGRNNCLIINPATDTTNTTTFGGVVPSFANPGFQWASSVRCLVDDKIYATGASNYLIVIDTSTGVLGTAVRNNFGLSAMSRGQRYNGIANGKDGLLHLTPSGGTSTIFGAVQKFYSYVQPIGGGSFDLDISGSNSVAPGALISYGAVNGDDGGVYATPSGAGFTQGKFIYNRSGSLNDVQWGNFNISIPADHRWWGGCLAPNGKIYSLPDMGTATGSTGLRRVILVTDTAGTGRSGPSFRTLIDTSYFNKGGT